MPEGEHYLAQGIYHHNSGKSLACAVEIVRMARLYPGIRIVVCAAFDYYFDEFLMPTFWDVFPEENNKHKKSYNYKTRTLRFVNGSQIRWKAYDDPNKVKGWEAHVIWIEEASELGDGNNDKALQIFQALTMRLRAARPKYPLQMIVSQNPKGHNWVWKVFIKDEPNRGVRQKHGDNGLKTVFARTAAGRERYFCEWEKLLPTGDVFYSIAVNTDANAHIPMGYVETMLGQLADDPQLKQRMVDGLFNPINMLVYEMPYYSEHTHLIDWHRFLSYWELTEFNEIPYFWPVIVGIDCAGARSPWAIEFYVQTPEDHWVCYDEIYTVGDTWDEICDKILEKTDGLSSVEYFIDPISSQQRQGPTSVTIMDEFRKRGIHTKTPKGYSKTGGMLHVRGLLKPDKTHPCPYKDDILQEKDGYAFGCASIYYLTNVPWKKGTTNPDAHACPGNIAEKRVFRHDASKVRQPKESEEGLSPVQSEKFVDRDDHAQTAEMFAFLSRYQITTKRRKGQAENEPQRDPEVRYGRRNERREKMRRL